MKVKITSLALLLTVSSPALADRAGADKCAANLPKDAKAVYDATAPGFASASDARQLITDRVRGLVMSGTLSMSGARPAAEAAGKCLVMLK